MKSIEKDMVQWVEELTEQNKLMIAERVSRVGIGILAVLGWQHDLVWTGPK